MSQNNARKLNLVMQSFNLQRSPITNAHNRHWN